MTARADGAATATSSARPVAAPPAEPTEAQMMRAILHAGRILHWRVAHFRPGQTRHGWRTAVQGDGGGFPDIVMVHAPAGLVWWVELKMKGGRLDVEQRRWRDDLRAAGQDWRLIVGRAGLTELLDDMAHLPRAVGR